MAAVTQWLWKQILYKILHFVDSAFILLSLPLHFSINQLILFERAKSAMIGLRVIRYFLR